MTNSTPAPVPDLPPHQRLSAHQELERLAAEQHVEPLRHLDDLASDLWESDQELEEFLTAVRQWRNADLA